MRSVADVRETALPRRRPAEVVAPAAPRLGRILVIEDEQDVAELMRYNLAKEGGDVRLSANGIDGLRHAREWRPDVILLDIMVPDLNGWEICRRLKQDAETRNIRVLMVTGRVDESDKVLGLEMGADDYVTKPFSSRELVARIRAVLRRGGDTDDLVANALEAGPVRMDVERHTVAVDGETVSLPLKEFDLLELLLRNAGRVLTRGQLIDRVWGADYVGDTKTLDVHVKRLRSKIEPDPANPKYLVTVRGLGYKFEA
jgi:two-component system response regulator RegX3